MTKKFQVKWRKVENLLFFASVALTLFFASITKNFLSVSNMYGLMTSFSMLMLIAVGPTVVILVGSLDISYPGLLSIVPVSVAMLLPRFGLGALAIGILIGIAIGFTNGILVTKGKVPSLLATLGTLFIGLGYSDFLTLGIPKALTFPLDFLLPSNPIFPFLLIWAIALTAVLWYVTRYTVFGIDLYAVGSSDLAARLSGINIEKTRLIAFVISSLFVSIGSILILAYIGAAGSSIGRNYLFPPLIAIAIGGTSLAGGVGGPHRTALGVYILSVIQNGLALLNIDPSSFNILLGIFLLISILAVSRQLEYRKV